MTKKPTINMENVSIKAKSQGKKNTLMVIVTGKNSDGERFSVTRHLRYDQKKKTYFGRSLNNPYMPEYVDFGTPEDWQAKELKKLEMEKAA